MELGQQGLRGGSFTPGKREMEKMKVMKRKTGWECDLGDKSHSGLDAVVLPELAKEAEEAGRV